MSMGIKARVLIIVPLIGLLGCAEQKADQIDPLLQGPMGLVWLESQESLIDRGFIGNMEEYFEAKGQSGQAVDWDELPYSKDDPSCLSETICISHQEHLFGDLLDRASFEFDQDRLFSVEIYYLVKWDAESQSIDLVGIDQQYQTLYSQISSKYGKGSNHDSMDTWSKVPVRIALSRSPTKNDDPQPSFVHVSVHYYFDIEKYNATLD